MRSLLCVPTPRAILAFLLASLLAPVPAFAAEDEATTATLPQDAPSASALGAPGARAGRIEFSDGRVLAGRISTTPGRQLKVYTAERASRSFPLAALRELRFAPMSTKMEAAWRFSAMASDEKEFAGDPVPHRELLTTATLANGDVLVGQLDVTVLYVEKPPPPPPASPTGTADAPAASGGSAEKVVVSHTQRGRAGQSLDALVYPVRIAFDEPAPLVSESRLLDFGALTRNARAQLAAVRRGTLKPLAVRAGGRAGAFRVEAPMGEGLYLALRDGERVLVGWPGGNAGDEATRARAEAAMAETKNFFTVRRLAAAWFDESQPQAYLCALVTLGREKPGGTAGFPWRLSVWRWRYDRKAGTVGQPPEEGLLLRIVDAQKEPPPEVVLNAELWDPQP